MIVGDGVVIEPLVADDAPALAESHSDTDNARHQGWKSPLSEAEALAFIGEQPTVESLAPGLAVQLAIREAEGGPLAGDLYLFRSEAAPETLEVGITLAPGFHHRGLATAAIRAVVDAARVAGIGRVMATVDVGNVRSRALFERLGFSLEERSDHEVVYRLTC